MHDYLRPTISLFHFSLIPPNQDLGMPRDIAIHRPSLYSDDRVSQKAIEEATGILTPGLSVFIAITTYRDVNPITTYRDVNPCSSRAFAR